MLPRLLSALLVLASLGMLRAVSPIPGSFRQIGSDGGGWVEGFAVHPTTGRVYARSDVGGLYRSDDHGATWVYLSGDFSTTATQFVQGVAVSAGSENVVYQAVGTSYDSSAGRGVWKSVDGGSSWTQVLSGVQFSGNDEERWGGECLVIQPGNDNELWAGTRGDGLRHSIDAGAHWTNVAPATFDTPNVVFCGITIHPSAPDHLWLATNGGAYVSTDHGVTWTKVMTMTRAYRVARKSDGTTFITGTNGGAAKLYRITATNWANPATYTSTDIYPKWLIGLPYTPSGSTDFAMITVLANGDLIAGNYFEFTRRSTNNGETWTTLPLTLTGPPAAWSDPAATKAASGQNHLVQDPTNPLRLYLTGGYGPFRSDDGGSTWRYIVNQLDETVTWRVAFHPTDAQRVWIPIADHGAATVSDGGASGTASGYVGWHFPFPDDNVLFSHRLLLSGTQALACGGNQGANQPRIYKSTDQGATWTRPALTGLATSAPRGIIDAVASSDNANDFIVFVGGTTGAGAAGIYRTTNGGANFTQSTGLPAGFDSGDLFYWHPSLGRSPSDVATRYLFLRNVGFYKSTDRGVTWTKPAPQPRDTYARLAVDAVNGRIWVGMDGTGLDFSDNAGTSWQASSAFTSVVELDAHGGRVAVLGLRTGDTWAKIYFSADNGATWNEITRPGFRFPSAQALAVDPWRPGTVWISTSGRSVARFTPWTPLEIWRNTNFGSPIPTGTSADDADFDGDGRANLIEYSLDLNPRAPDGFTRVTRQTVSALGQDYLSLRIERDQFHPDLTYRLEVSPDLVSWSSTATTIVSESATLLVLRDNTPISSVPGGRRFLRLRVTGP